MKECRICGLSSVSLSEMQKNFHKDSSKQYGFANICKKCKNEVTKFYRHQRRVVDNADMSGTVKF